MESDDCLVAVHAGGGHVDLVLPNQVPVGLLLPGMCDIVDETVPESGEWLGAGVRELRVPGGPPLDMSKTLCENGIRNGDTLALTTSSAVGYSPPALDSAEQLARQVRSTESGWTPGESRISALLVVVVLAGVVGFIAVPGTPAVPHLLLGASAAGAAAAVAARVVDRGRTVFAAQAFGCALIAAATLGTTALGGTAQHAGLALATVSTAVLVGAGRLTLMMCGLSSNATRDLDLDDRDRDRDRSLPLARDCLTAVVLAGAGAAAFGVILMVSRDPATPDCALAAAITATLLSRARAHTAADLRIALLLTGTTCAAASLVAIRYLIPAWTGWLCVVTAAAAAAVGAGYRAARPNPSPAARQIAHIAECAVLVSVVPLTCWGFGFYDDVRAMSLR